MGVIRGEELSSFKRYHLERAWGEVNGGYATPPTLSRNAEESSGLPRLYANGVGVFWMLGGSSGA